MSSSLYRWGRQPATSRVLSLPVFFSSAHSRILSMASDFALSMKAQVLMIRASASAGSSVML